MKKYIGIDIGGTNIKAAVIDENNNELGFRSVKTDREAVMKTAAKSVVALLAKHEIDPAGVAAIGVGIPGIIEGKKGPVVYTPNLGLNNHDAVSELAESFRASGIDFNPEIIFLENDANCAGIAESCLGEGKDAEYLLLLTLGTGLGGTVITHGKPLMLGKYGGELGHFPFMYGGKDCPCGISGCLERYTNSAAFKEFGFEKYTSFLAEGIAGFVNIFRPDLVVLAGGVTNEGAHFFKVLNEKMATSVYARDYIRPPKIVRTSLGNDAGAIGAALAGKQLLEQ